MAEQRESPTTIRDRAVAVADYLLAVRAQMERPARTVPSDAHWLDDLPRHPDCQAGPGADGTSWLRVGRPELPAPVSVPAALRQHLRGAVTAGQEPVGEDVGDAGFERWRDETWRPWAELTTAAEQTRDLHRRLFDRMHQLDMAEATTELVWGHGVLETTIDGNRVRYPLVATPVMIDYDADRALISVSPAGPSRLQVEALSGLDDRYLSQLVGLAGPGGTVEVDLWNDFERREFFERALTRMGFDRTVVTAGAEPVPDAIRDVTVLFARTRQRHLRVFLESLRDRLTAGDLAGVGSLAANVAHEPSRSELPGEQPQT